MIGVQNLKRRGSIDPGAVLPTATAWWRTSDYSGSGNLLDKSGNGLDFVMPGSNLPVWLAYVDHKYAYFPGLANNNVSVPNPGLVSSTATITYDDNTTDTTAASAANPLVFGNTDAKFTAKKVKSIVFATGLTGGIDFTACTEPFASYTDGNGNVWTFNRASSGLKLVVVDRNTLLFGGATSMSIADNALLDFSATDAFTIAIAYRAYDFVANAGLISKKAGATVGNVGWAIYGGVGRTITGRCSDGTVDRVSSSSCDSGVKTLTGWVRDRSIPNYRIYKNGSLTDTDADTTAATMDIANSVFLGKLGSAFADMGFFGAAVFRRGLTVGELLALSSELGMS